MMGFLKRGALTRNLSWTLIRTIGKARHEGTGILTVLLSPGHLRSSLGMRKPLCTPHSINANAKQIQPVGAKLHSILFCDLLLKGFYLRIFKLHNVTTSSADQMIMMSSRMGYFEHRATVLKRLLLDKARFRQKIQRPIDGRKTYIVTIFTNPTMQLLGVNMGVQ
jgi:hypothetical protein